MCGHTLDQAVMRSRPCLYVGCAHHLYLDINPKDGKIKYNFSVLPEEMGDSCVLDVAEEGETTLDVVGAKLGVTRERARQIEARCMTILHRAITSNSLHQLLPESDSPEDEDELPHAPPPEATVEFGEAIRSRGEAKRAYLAANTAAMRLVFHPAPILRLAEVLAFYRARQRVLDRFGHN